VGKWPPSNINCLFPFLPIVRAIIYSQLKVHFTRAILFPRRAAAATMHPQTVWFFLSVIAQIFGGCGRKGIAGH
jgi:hypothetical protein